MGQVRICGSSGGNPQSDPASFRVPEIQYEKMSRSEQVCRGRGLIFRQATERWPGRYWEARYLAITPS